MESLRFGRFTWHPVQRTLMLDGARLRLGARACDVLALLIQHQDRVVGKAELLDRAWASAVVEENNLTVQVSALRKLIGRECIATVAGQGYRWAARLAPAADAAAPASGTASAQRPTISVLPFEVRGSQRQQDYLGDGMAQDIAAGLSKSPWLLVIAHDSARTYRGSALGLREISDQLGAKYLVRGSIARPAGRIRITVELIFGPTAELLMSERFDRAARDLFEVEDEVTRRVIGAVEPPFLRSEEARARQPAKADLPQWELLMRARWHYWRSSRWHCSEAQRLLRQALKRHPDDGTALALMAFGKATEVWSGWARDPAAASMQACSMAMKAVALDDRDSWAHFMLGVASQGLGDLDRAIAEHRRALELYPHFAAAAGELGRMLIFSGDTQAGAALIRQAISWSPAEPHMSLWLFGLAMAHFIEGDHAAAARLAQQAVDTRPDWFFNQYLRAACLALDGQTSSARAAYEQARRLLPSFDRRILERGHPFRDPAHRDRYVRGLMQLGWPG